MTRWTTADIARFYGVQRRTVTENWTKKPDFPKPVERINQKVVRWSAEDVQKWATAGAR